MHNIHMCIDMIYTKNHLEMQDQVERPKTTMQIEHSALLVHASATLGEAEDPS